MRIILLAFIILFHSSGICETDNNEVLFAKSQMAYNQKNWVQALHYLRVILKNQSEHTQARLLKAQIYLEQGNNTSAARSYQNILAKQIELDKKKKTISEKSLELSFRLAKAYFATYTSPEAHQYAKEKIKEKMIHLFNFCYNNKYLLKTVNYYLGYIYYLEKNKAKSIFHLKKVLKLAKENRNDEMSLLAQFYLSLQFIPAGHEKEAKLQLFSLLNSLKKNKHPLRDQFFASSIENLKRLSDPRFSLFAGISQTSTDNAISTKDHIREINKNLTKSSFTDLRLNMNYKTKSMRKWLANFNLFLKQSRQDHSRFFAESNRNIGLKTNLIYQKYNGKFHHFDLSFSKSQIGTSADKNSWTDFSRNITLSYKFEQISSHGSWGLQTPLYLSNYQEGLSSDKRLYLISHFDFHPITSLIDPYLELQLGYENLGISKDDAIAVKFHLLNSMSNQEFLLQQSLFLEYYNFTRNGLVDFNFGMNLDLYYFLPIKLSSALKFGYSFEKEITTPVQISNRRVNTFSLGLEFYY